MSTCPPRPEPSQVPSHRAIEVGRRLPSVDPHATPTAINRTVSTSLDVTKPLLRGSRGGEIRTPGLLLPNLTERNISEIRLVPDRVESYS